MFVLAFFETFIKPAAGVRPAGSFEVAFHFPVVTGHKGADFFLALHDQRQGRRLHAADGGEVEAAGFGVKRGHGTRAIDTD